MEGGAILLLMAAVVYAAGAWWFIRAQRIWREAAEVQQVAWAMQGKLSAERREVDAALADVSRLRREVQAALEENQRATLGRIEIAERALSESRALWNYGATDEAVEVLRAAGMRMREGS